ncbi:MAG: DUF4906 domain-containing protein [Alistipes sp.]|nr:DUF4906 domain-containing protein [Alistipes sp.]
MKNLYRYAVIVAMTFLGMSCVNNDYELDTLYPNTEGNSKLKVHFSVKDSELVTRAAQDVSYEYNVQSIYVFVFSGDNRVALSNDITDTNGNINYFDLEEIVDEHNKTTVDDDDISTGVLNLGAVAGSNMRICLIANIGVSNSETRAEMTDAISNEVDVFDDIQKYSDLQKLVLKLGVNSVQRQSAFLLTGEATGVSLDPNPDAVTEVTVPLYRTDAKITFNVKAENANLQDFKFVPKTWRVMNAPATTYAIPNSEVSADTSIGVGKYLDALNVKSEGEDVYYFDSPEVSFEGKVQDDVENSGTFTFYMYENLKGPKQEIGEDGSYALREKQEKMDPEDGDVLVPDQSVINGNYVYAPELGTYVVFTGQLSYTHKSTTESGIEYEEYVMADVEYSVHLGHNSDTDFNDYKTLRNHHYTYNVTVTGVNDLLVEVEGVDGDGNKEEKRPGVEGEVVMSSAQVIEVDGHYDRALITFTTEEAKNIFFAVNTPWERGLDTNGFLNSELDSYVNDYKWIKFLVNKDYDIANNEYAPFPGEQCYDGGTTKFGTAAQSDAYNQGVILRDIRQLSNYFAANTPTENVTVTAFIDEYLYNYNPRNDDNRVTSKNGDTETVTTVYKSITDETISPDELLLWKRSVNNNARMMHIVKKGDMKYSEDGQTSLSRSVVSIYQKPILSLYNHMATNLKTAWGVETVNETPKMIVSRTDYPNSSGDNYYTYAQKLISGNTWASVISSTDRYGLKSTYNDPSYACALRNRDFDGNGNIDQNEMQWYLAALDQMSGLWIADPIFTEKMFDPQNPDGYYPIDGITAPATHYVTSTIRNSSPMVYWAEEFGATSTHDAAIGWRQAVVPDSYVETYRDMELDTNETAGLNNIKEVRNNAIVSVRCVRNFGAKYTSTDLPQDYYIVTQPSGGDGTIDLTYINAAVLRTAPDSSIALAYGDVNTTTENNRPYTGFFVKNESVAIYNSGGWRKAYDGEVSGTNRVCSPGYRVPNQREMILMSITLESWDNQGAYTMFNGQYLDYYNPAKFGEFYYITPNADYNWNPDRIARQRSQVDSNNIGVGNAFAQTVYVRCVKDNPDAKQDDSSQFEDEGDNW